MRSMRIYVDTVCDLFHRGHVEFFKLIKKTYPNCYLIVGVHSDLTVKSYKRAPVFAMEDRVELVASCRYVDQVQPDAPLDVTERFMEKEMIDLVVYSDELSEAQREHYRVPIRLGRFATVARYEGISTTQIIEKVCGEYCGKDD